MEAGLENEVRVESCGTGGGSSDWYMPGGFSYHLGDRADSRMRKEASKRFIDITSRSYPLTASMIDEFQMIIAMDQDNHDTILEAARYVRCHMLLSHYFVTDTFTFGHSGVRKRLLDQS